jgi:hypothetical protein
MSKKLTRRISTVLGISPVDKITKEVAKIHRKDERVLISWPWIHEETGIQFVTYVTNYTKTIIGLYMEKKVIVKDIDEDEVMPEYVATIVMESKKNFTNIMDLNEVHVVLKTITNKYKPM